MEFNFNQDFLDTALFSTLLQKEIEKEHFKDDQSKNLKSKQSINKESVSKHTESKPTQYMKKPAKSTSVPAEVLKQPKTDFGFVSTMKKDFNGDISKMDMKSIDTELKELDKQISDCKLENTRYFDFIAKNNETIEVDEIRRSKLLARQEELKKIASNPFYDFNRDVNVVLNKSLSDFNDSELGDIIKQLLKKIESLSKCLIENGIHISVNKLPAGQYSIMIESSKTTPEISKNIKSLRQAFSMLNNLF